MNEGIRENKIIQPFIRKSGKWWKVKIFKSKNGIKSAINKLQQLNPNYNYKIKNIYRTTKISSYYYKEQIVQNNKSMLMLSNNKQCVNNNIHDKRIVLLKK